MHKNITTSLTFKKQSGAVLLVSMVILVVLTLLGVTSMKGSLTELTMSGNLRESGLTFQAAEAGLVFAENFIESTSSEVEFNGTTSLLKEDSNSPDYLDDTTWSSASSAVVSLGDIKTNPKYIIHYIGKVDPNANVNSLSIHGYGSPGSIVIHTFRVTSRGTGQTDDFSKVVQSYYAREY